MVKYKNNPILSLIPDYDYYILDNRKQWGWDNNTILNTTKVISDNIDDIIDPNILKGKKSTTSIIKFINCYKSL